MFARQLRLGCMIALAGALSGCGDLGPVQGVADTVMGVVQPLIAMVMPKPEETPPPFVPRPRRRPRRQIEGIREETPANATDSADASSSALTPAAAAALTERNKNFDRLRTQGLVQLYSGQTAAALQSFKQAQALKPQDPTIRRLIDLTLHPASYVSGQPGGQAQGGMMQLPGSPQAPGVPNGTTDALKALLNQAKGAQQGQAGGDKPAGLFQ